MQNKIQEILNNTLSVKTIGNENLVVSGIINASEQINRLFADASKEEPKGLEELRYPKDIIQLIWLGKKSACNKDCKCHAECEEADNFISKLRVANQIPNNEELKQKLEFIKQEYINCVNDIDEILDTVQECIEIVSGVSNTSESPTFLEVMKENTELKIRLQLIKIENQIWGSNTKRLKKEAT